VIEQTVDGDQLTLQLALDYGGKDEIVRAIQRLSDQQTLTEEDIGQHVDHPELPNMDIVLRTSGEQRTSNFFLWQTAYAEWFFVKPSFPELTVDILQQTLDEYEKRQRRYGAG
jgi:undecaprenyl diphosphate synthase